MEEISSENIFDILKKSAGFWARLLDFRAFFSRQYLLTSNFACFLFLPVLFSSKTLDEGSKCYLQPILMFRRDADTIMEVLVKWIG